MFDVECRIGRTLRSCCIESNIWYVFESILQWSMYPDRSSIHHQETLRTQFLASWFQPVSLLDEQLYRRLDFCFSPGHVEYLQIYGNFWYMLGLGLTLCSRRSNLHSVSRGLVDQYWKQWLWKRGCGQPKELGCIPPTTVEDHPLEPTLLDNSLKLRSPNY